jgi:hypothetical protein
VASVAFSADWIATEYNNQSSPSTFWTVGTPLSTAQPVPGVMIRLTEADFDASFSSAARTVYPKLR